MKKISDSITLSTVRNMAFIGAAILFAFLLLGFDRQQNRSEKLLGITFDDEKKEVTIKVTSTGCTEKNYFQFKVRGTVIEIIRTKRDECKRMPFATSFTYSMAETGLVPNKVYTIKNKFSASSDLANLP